MDRIPPRSKRNAMVQWKIPLRGVGAPASPSGYVDYIANRVEEFRIAKQKFDKEDRKLRMVAQKLMHTGPYDGKAEEIAEAKAEHSKFLEESAGLRSIIKGSR
ncbi:hypothetical protein H4I96_07033 [Botrytis cinerea]